jgi:hypothetical protein
LAGILQSPNYLKTNVLTANKSLLRRPFAVKSPFLASPVQIAAHDTNPPIALPAKYPPTTF